MATKKYIWKVYDCEHEGDINYEWSRIIDCGGTPTSYDWSGEDGDIAYIHLELDEEMAEEFKNKMANF